MKKLDVERVDEKINYRRFSKPTFDIYDERICKKFAEVFLKLAEEDKTKEGRRDV